MWCQEPAGHVTLFAVERIYLPLTEPFVEEKPETDLCWHDKALA